MHARGDPRETPPIRHLNTNALRIRHGVGCGPESRASDVFRSTILELGFLRQ
jgi:hypothetical protein